MALLNEEQLKKQINNGDFSRVYLIYGNEGYLKQFYSSRISAKAINNDFADFNLKKLDGKTASLNEIYDCISTFPMMDSYTCTIVSDFNLASLVSDTGKLDKDFEDIINDIPETSILVFWMDTIEVDLKSKKWAKIIKLIDSVGICAQLDKRTRSALEKLLISSAAKKDCTLQKNIASYMINLIGEDMSTLQNELNKVCAFVGSGEITKSAVDETVIISVEAKIFQLARMIANGEADNAFENLANLFKLREEPVVILSVLSKSYVDMYRVKACKDKGCSYTVLSDAFPSAYKNRGFILDNAAKDSNGYSIARLKEALMLLSAADRRLKSTNDDSKTVLEELILRLLRV